MPFHFGTDEEYVVFWCWHVKSIPGFKIIFIFPKKSIILVEYLGKKSFFLYFRPDCDSNTHNFCLVSIIRGPEISQG